ncbi:BRO-N domain-containing protein [Comamonas jiangduensis]|uniref:Bro-N domain-containing protein n=1 Tax=Comamonas jiangduensis TaxID=1194168 RepID=A0ABV4IJ32_9BURK
MAENLNKRAAALSFRSTTFEIVDQHGQHWLKASDLARALGYAREDAVSRIYERNASEFHKGMTQTVNLTVSQNNGQLQRETRIFSLRGAHLLAMFARTSVAKEFRTWVLDVLEQQTGNHGQPPEATSRIDLARQLAHAATAQVYQAVFDAVLKDGEPPHFTRLLLGFTGNSHELRPHVQALEVGSIAMTLPQLAKAIRTDLMVPDTTLAHLAAACTARMAERAEAQARHAAAQSAAPAGITQGSLQLRQARH